LADLEAAKMQTIKDINEAPSSIKDKAITSRLFKEICAEEVLGEGRIADMTKKAMVSNTLHYVFNGDRFLENGQTNQEGLASRAMHDEDGDKEGIRLLATNKKKKQQQNNFYIYFQKKEEAEKHMDEIPVDRQPIPVEHPSDRQPYTLGIRFPSQITSRRAHRNAVSFPLTQPYGGDSTSEDEDVVLKAAAKIRARNDTQLMSPDSQPSLPGILPVRSTPSTAQPLRVLSKGKGKTPFLIRHRKKRRLLHLRLRRR
jgi:hypothetical protein